MGKCVSCGKGTVVVDYEEKTNIYSCDKCGYIDSVAFPDGSVFEGEFKDNFFPNTKFKKLTGTLTDRFGVGNDEIKEIWKDDKDRVAACETIFMIYVLDLWLETHA